MPAKVACFLACALSVCAASQPPAIRQDNVPELFHGVQIVGSIPTIIATSHRNAAARSGGWPRAERRLLLLRKARAEQELWSIYRRKATGGPDELPIDPAPLSADH